MSVPKIQQTETTPVCWDPGSRKVIEGRESLGRRGGFEREGGVLFLVGRGEREKKIDD